MSKLKDILNELKNSEEGQKDLLEILVKTLDLRKNDFHPLVFVNGSPEIGENVYIGLFSEINAKGGKVTIGRDCDIASFVSINVADSHLKTIEKADDVKRSKIVLEERVFVGSHCFIGGDVHLGHHTVVGSGSVLMDVGYVPPYSLVVGNPAVVKPGYYAKNTPQ